MTNEQLAILLKSYAKHLEIALSQSEERLELYGKVLVPEKHDKALEPVRDFLTDLQEDAQKLEKGQA